MLNYLRSEAHEVQDDLLEKHASDGDLRSRYPTCCNSHPFSHHGNVNEIIGKFGGADQLCSSVN